MKILGIETSCDETAAAVVEDGVRVISNVVNSQVDIHAKYGGVVPEVAARSHIEVVNLVISEAVEGAGGWDEIDAIAVTHMPGLMGSLLIGTLAARTLAVLKKKPLYLVHHIEGHIYANFLRFAHEEKPCFPSSRGRPAKPDQAGCSPSLTQQGGIFRDLPRFPILAMVVSGGHTQLIFMRGHGDFDVIGTTRDDAVGEVFDKVAKIIGLPYPGGPAIGKAALLGDRERYKLPKAKLDTPYDFSFSGLKTAVLRAVQKEVGKGLDFPSHGLAELLSEEQRNDFAASFEKVAVETLVDKLLKAYAEYEPATVVIAGGVAANGFLREEIARQLPCSIDYAAMEFCTDNAAMIASAGYFRVLTGAPADPYEVDVSPTK